VIETHLVNKGPCLCGSEISAADIYLAMLASWYEPDMTALGRQFPRILGIHNTVAARPSWQTVQTANAS
jgi:glutathione S-transferase